MKLLYIDCFSGIAGDMMLGALLDLGLDEAHLRAELAKLGLKDWSLSVETARRHGIAGRDVRVVDEHRGEDHHGHGRHWSDIRALIERSDLAVDVRDLALGIFRRLAEAEGKLHGVDPEQIHFHEVGGVDAIVDICGAAIGLRALGVERVVCAPVPAPRGFVRCEHGRMPLPAPATFELLRGASLVEVDAQGEWVTPTGAAILAHTVDAFGPIPSMRVEAIGYGVGDRDPEERANLLRLVLGTAPQRATHGHDLQIEANIDDMSGELFGPLVDRLFDAGALDVWLVPIQMKKGRPGTTLSVLCAPDDRQPVIDVILRESTTIGVRITPVERYKTARTLETVDTPLGPVRVKVARDGTRVVNRAPEFEDCRRLASEHGLPLKKVLQTVHGAVAKKSKTAP